MGMTGKRIWDLPVFGGSEGAQPLTNQLSPEKLQQIARSITVKVLSNKTGGSGILVSEKRANDKKEYIYSVLTNRHVLVPGESYRIQTPDGKIYQANVVKDVNFKGSDLALLQFTSAQDYTLAELMSVSTLAVNQQVFAAGFVSDAEKLVFTTGEVSLLPDKAFQDGYQIGYTNNVHKGMSGGPILNQRGEVIGINGIIANPIWGDPYVFQDGSKPNAIEREKMSSYSWGIAIKTAVDLAPEFVETNRVKELDRIAEETTVRIDFPNGNGSGVIIAKQGGFFTNNYYILTAYHVVNEAVKYQVVTPDGRRHSVDYGTVKRLPGVDLAVLEFTSNQTYRVASLASNSLFNKDDWDFVCVSGWPISKVTGDKPTRLFSVGEIIKPDLIQLVKKDAGSLTDGYEMVYSNITAGGVSGGQVLNIDGQVIGIHGRADGEETIDHAGEQRPIQLGYSFGIPINKFLGMTSQIGVKLGELKIDYPVFPDLISDGKSVRAKEKKMRDILNVIINIFKIKHLKTFNDPIELTNYANRLWRIGDYENALAALNIAIKIQPKLYHAWYLRGLVLYSQQRFLFNKQKLKPTNQEILASFSMATIIEPKFSPAWRWQGILLQLLERYEESIKSINEAISLDSKDSTLHHLKGDFFTKLKQYEEAIAAYTQSIEIQPSSYAYFNRGLLKYDYKKEQKGALSDYTEAIKLDPDLVEAYANRGVVRNVLGDTQGALDDYAQAIKLKPDYAEVYARRGAVHFLLKNKKEALADYEKAIRLKPNYVEAYLVLGSYYFDSENLEAAITSLTKAISLNRNLFAAYSLRAAAYYKRNDIQNAITDFTQAIQINPDYLEAYQGRGKLYHNIGNYQNSILDFSQVIRLKSNDFQAYNKRGIAYVRINNFQKALDDFERVIQLNPNLAEAYLNRGITKFSLNDYSGTVDDLTQAIARPSSDKMCTACVHLIRGMAQSKLRNPQGAVADFEKAAQLFREEGDMAKYQSALDLLMEVQK
jgi:tetratricopeptide (TPR) repeat protein/S1-C subfamily serine protease